MHLLWLESREPGMSNLGEKGHIPHLLSPLTPAVGIGSNTREQGYALGCGGGNGTLQCEVFPCTQLPLQTLTHNAKPPESEINFSFAALL